eukprot:TRINITY_DN12766_c0_g1_i1.p1 TRINITY_DN12766_c0_g1~~TRINITY_DN12766_c0_g1_i1.p1  ORF type:complete len:546 (-),score=66.56 TRINITY_DN12766_c0_g1_i1:1171-2808(-)
MQESTPPSIFNDVLGPVMRGPSSSHCAAALRIGRLARDLTNGTLTHVEVRYDTAGSLATTHEGQGSDMGLCGGLLGWDCTDARLPQFRDHLATAGITVEVRIMELNDAHPNTYNLTLHTAGDGSEHTLTALSTGGGMIEVIAIDGFSSPRLLLGDYWEYLFYFINETQATAALQWLRGALAGAELVRICVPCARPFVQVKSTKKIDEIDAVVTSLGGAVGKPAVVRELRPVLPVLSRRDLQVPFLSSSDMLRTAKQGTSLADLAIEYEMLRGNVTKEQVLKLGQSILRVMQESVANGLRGTHYSDRILGFQSGNFQKKMLAGGLIGGDSPLNKVVVNVTAIMETKSSMGVIVAAPTAGACAALPGAILGVAEALGISDEDIVKGLLAAGIIGVFICAHATFAAEVGGCQAEGGSASCMAAAALATMMGADCFTAVAAAAMALQNCLGLICDPVANRVEVPCLGKNVMAASNALCCTNMALAGYAEVVPLDQVITAMYAVAKAMPSTLRCTMGGGLSVTPASIELEDRLRRHASACRSGCSCKELF